MKTVSTDLRPAVLGRLLAGAALAALSSPAAAQATTAPDAPPSPQALIDGFEGAFGTHLLEHDAVEPSIMFGRAGLVDAGALRIGSTPGHGMTTNKPAQHIDLAGAPTRRALDAAVD